MKSIVRRSAATLVSAGALTAWIIGSYPAGAQDTGAAKSQAPRSKQVKKAEPPTSAPPVSPAASPSQSKGATRNAPPDAIHRVPPGYAALGLTEQQKQKLYDIRGKYYPRIQALRKEIVGIEDKMKSESESVLTAQQRRQFEMTKKAEAESKKAAAAKKAE